MILLFMSNFSHSNQISDQHLNILVILLISVITSTFNHFHPVQLNGRYKTPCTYDSEAMRLKIAPYRADDNNLEPRICTIAMMVLGSHNCVKVLLTRNLVLRPVHVRRVFQCTRHI